METFAEISKIPLFAAGIEELVYDARLFWRHLLDGNIYKIAHRRYQDPHPEEADTYRYAERRHLADWASDQANGDQYELRQRHHAELLRSRDRYYEVHHEQQAILDEGQDYETLCAGLQSLSNVDKITISETFALPRDVMDHARIDRTWPDSLMERLAGDSIPPKAWESSHYGCISYQHQGITRGLRWDCQHVVNLLRAAAVHCPKLKELRLGYLDSPMSLEIFAESRGLESARELMHHLEVLELRCSSSLSMQSEGVDQCVSNLVSLVQGARSLWRFSLSLDVDSTLLAEFFFEASLRKV